MAVVFFVAATSAAGAHAVLIEQFPPANAALSAAPDEVRLRFNEVVTPVLVRVLDAAGKAVTVPSAVSETDTTLHIALPSRLAAGNYVVSYRVISADSHPVGGSFVFAIGQAAADAGLADRIGAARDADLWSAVTTALRAVLYAAFLIGAGGGLFVALVDDAVPRSRDARRLVVVASSLATLALLISIGVEGAAAAGAPLAALLDPVIWRIGLDSTVGLSAALTIAGLAITVAGVMRPTRRAHPVIVAGVVLGAAGFAATGHVATAPPRWLSVPCLVLHVLCAAFWIGALLPLAWRLRRQPAAVVPVITRFSGCAIGAVAILLIAGTVIAALQLKTPAALIDTPYGRRLAVKLVLVLALLLLAAINRLRLTPRLALAAGLTARQLRTTIAAELALSGGVVLATAMLGQVPPPRSLAAEMPADHIMATAMRAPGIAIATRASDRSAIVEMTPARPGENRIAVTFIDADGVVVAPREVAVWLSMPALGIEPEKHEAERDAAGGYAVTARLPVTGTWRVEIDALVSDFERTVFTTEAAIQ